MYVHAARVARVSALLLLAGCVGEVAEPHPDGDDESTTRVGAPQLREPAIETVSVTISADSTIRAQSANRNFGGAETLDVNRSLLLVDNAALTQAVGASDFVVSAALELALLEDETRAEGEPRVLDVHRMTRTWTELGATWNCGIDTRPNRRADCARGTAWNMSSSNAPFVPAPTGSVEIPLTATGGVEIDVTADVRAFVARTAKNYGWLLKTGDAQQATEFSSREGASAPVLKLTVQRCSPVLCDDDNACTIDGCSELGTCVHTDLENGSVCDDGNACTVADSCAQGTCAGETAPDGTACGDGETCNIGVCGGAAPQVVINEIESSGGEPGDWVELYNAGDDAVDLSGFLFKDNDDTHAFFAIPEGTVLAGGAFLVIEEAQIGFGLGGADSARLFDPNGVDIVDSYAWEAHATTSYGRCPDGSGEFATTAIVTKGAANDCESDEPDGGPQGSPIVINEVESSGGVPGDWVELFNAGAATVDVSGYRFKDNDDTHAFYAIPAGTQLAPGAFLILEEADIGFGLGGADSARLFDATSDTPIDTHDWSAHAATTFGRCPDGTGAFATTALPTKGSANDCTPDGTVFSPWPGSASTTVSDAEGAFASNVSGLVFQAASTIAPAYLWAVQNSPSVLYRLEQDGVIWSPSTSDDWAGGKTLVYPSGSGSPDAEGVTRTGTPFVYVVSERDNDASDVSRLSILRFDVEATGDVLIATHEWDVTTELPAVGANTGLEGIAFVPDAYLTSRGFIDEATGQAYDPANYAEHGAGLFLVGVEAGGAIYAFALDHATSTSTLVATIESGQAAVMDLAFDAETSALWSYCDNVCGNKATVLGIDTDAASATFGSFIVQAAFERPAGLPDVGNEGFAIAACTGDEKPVFWADDEATGAHTLRTGALSCQPPF